MLFQVLDLHDNQLASLPADIGQLTALQVKDLQLHPRCLYRACLGTAGCGVTAVWFIINHNFCDGAILSDLSHHPDCCC